MLIIVMVKAIITIFLILLNYRFKTYENEVDASNIREALHNGFKIATLYTSGLILIHFYYFYKIINLNSISIIKYSFLVWAFCFVVYGIFFPFLLYSAKKLIEKKQYIQKNGEEKEAKII